MQILVPDDTIFVEKLTRIEDALLNSLYYYYLRDLEEEQAERVKSAWNGIGKLLRLVPSWIPAWSASQEAGSVPVLPEGYRLHDSSGRTLRSLCIVDVGEADRLAPLRGCFDMLVRAQAEPRDPLAEILAEMAADVGPRLLDDFRGVLEVMELQAPPSLRQALARGMASGQGAVVSLDAARLEEYQDLCRRIVDALSGGADEFGYASHRAMYS